MDAAGLRVSEVSTIPLETRGRLVLLILLGGGGQDRIADLRVMKTPITNTINYLHAVKGRQNTPKYM